MKGFIYFYSCDHNVARASQLKAGLASTRASTRKKSIPRAAERWVVPAAQIKHVLSPKQQASSANTDDWPQLVG